MSDKAVVFFIDELSVNNNETSCGVYLHSSGSEVEAILAVLQARSRTMRRKLDAAYAAAQFAAIAANKNVNLNGVGLVAPIEPTLNGLESVACGDWGVLIVDLRNEMHVTQHLNDKDKCYAG